MHHDLDQNCEQQEQRWQAAAEVWWQWFRLVLGMDGAGRNLDDCFSVAKWGIEEHLQLSKECFKIFVPGQFYLLLTYTHPDTVALDILFYSHICIEKH